MATTEAALVDCIGVLEDVIRSRQDAASRHDPTPSDFFGIIVTLLGTGATEEKTGLMLQILAAVIPKTSSTLVRTYFKPVFQALGKIIQSTEENTLIEVCLTCLGLLLKEQDASDGFWNGLSALQATNTLLTFIDSEPRLRKAAFKALLAIAESHTKQRALAFRSYLGEFMQGVFQEATRTNYRRAHCAVVFLESALPLLPDTQFKKVVGQALRLQDCGIPRLTAAVYRMVDSFLQSPGLRLSAAGARSVTKQLAAHYPSTLDVETHCHYVSSLATSLVSLQEAAAPGHGDGNGNGVVDVELLQRSLALLQRSLASEFSQVHVAVAAAFKRVAFALLGEAQRQALQTWLASLPVEVTDIAQVTGSSVPAVASVARELVGFCVQGLQLSTAPAWLQVLDGLRAMFQLLRGQQWAGGLVSPLVSALGDVYAAVEAQQLPEGLATSREQLTRALTETLGAALQAAGLKRFLALLPIVDTSGGSGGDALVTRDWVVGVLHDHLSHCALRLSEFVTVLLPLAQVFHQLRQRTATQLAAAEAHHATARNAESYAAANNLRKRQRLFRDKVVQVWALFPEVCAAPLLDVATSVPKIVPILQTALQDADYPELGFAVVVGVHRWVAPDRGHLAAHRGVFEAVAPTLLPLLLGVLEHTNMGDARFQETLDCVTSYLQLAPPGVLAAITKRLLQTVLSHTTAQTLAAGDSGDAEAQRAQQVAAVWMAVLMAAVAQAPPAIVVVMYKTVKPLLQLTTEAHGLQKRAYQLLHVLLEQRADVVHAQADALEHLLQLLVAALPAAHASSRNVRMRCIARLLAQLEDVELITQACATLGPEVLAALKDANRKTRLQAVEIVQVLTLKLPWETLFGGFAAPLTTPTAPPLAKAAAVTALCVLLMEYASKRFALDEDAADAADDEAAAALAAQLAMYQASCQGVVAEVLRLLHGGVFAAMVAAEPTAAHQAKALLSLFKLVCTYATREVLTLDEVAAVLHFVARSLGAVKHKFTARVRALYRKVMRKHLRPAGDADGSGNGDGNADEAEAALRRAVPAEDAALFDYLLRLQRKRTRRLQQQKTVYRREKFARHARATDAAYDRLMNSDSEDDAEDEDEDDELDGDTRPFAGASLRGSVRGGGRGAELRSAVARSILGSVRLGGDDAGGDADGDAADEAGGADAEDFRLQKKKRFVATRSVATKSRFGGTRGARSVAGGGGAFDHDDVDEDADGARGRGADDRFELVVGDDGRLVVQLHAQFATAAAATAAPASSTKMDADGDEDDDVDADATERGSAKMKRLLQEKHAAAAAQSHWRQQKKDAKEAAQRRKFNLRDPGAEYRAKNAGGDVWKKGALQPHAYIPLDPRLLSKKHKAAAVEHFGQVVSHHGGRRKLKLPPRK